MRVLQNELFGHGVGCARFRRITLQDMVGVNRKVVRHGTCLNLALTLLLLFICSPFMVSFFLMIQKYDVCETLVRH